MSRLNKGERSNQQRGRPKRRAAASHLFKYQLAQNPGKAEEDALKRALQESLEEHNDVPSPARTAANKNVIRSKKSRVINSSTNSSDVSKTSNNSTSTSNTSRSSLNGSLKKRTRSNSASPSSTLLSNKRAKLATNGHKQINNTSNGNNKDKCDNESSVLAGTPPPTLNKAIRTYSRSQEINGHRDLRQQKPPVDVIPRSSTPIAKKPSFSAEEKAPDISIGSLNKNNLVSVSRSTQTSVSKVKSSNISINGRKINDRDSKSPNHPRVVDDLVPATLDTCQAAPVDDKQHPNLKRESKNYAYAKMTALKVNTYKSPYDYLKTTSARKVSPTGVLNSNSNKNTSKTISKLKKSSQQTTQSGDVVARAGKKSPSPNTTREPNHTKSSLGKSAIKSISKHLSVVPRGLKNDHSPDTVDLSNVNIQSQTSVIVTKKATSSWSLLGVPEERIIYLRDDEPPRRLICYPAIKHVEGDVIQVRDSVLLRSGAKTTDLTYIAKVCAFWEDAETGGVMMSLFWYYRPEHIEDGRKPHHLPDEIFASRHRDVDSVECIEDKCYVLTFNEYCRYKKRVKMEQVGASWSLADVTIPVSNESYPRRNRIPDPDVNPELVFCCRQIYDSRMKRLIKNPLINSKYGHI